MKPRGEGQKSEEEERNGQARVGLLVGMLGFVEIALTLIFHWSELSIKVDQYLVGSGLQN